MKGFQHFSQPYIQSINSDSVLKICTSVCVYKNRHKRGNRGELPRIKETAAKLQGKTHDNWWNSKFLSVHSSKSLAQMLAGSSQHCLWWLCSTCLQGLTGVAVPGLPRAAARMRCLAGLSLTGHHHSVGLQTQGSAARCTARGTEWLRWA